MNISPHPKRTPLRKKVHFPRFLCPLLISLGWLIFVQRDLWFLYRTNDVMTSFVNSFYLSSELIPEESEKCAICLWGLPRAFKAIVLPSLVRNVIEPNAKYNCDYFVHFHDLGFEPAGRSGAGGVVNASEIYLLQEKVEEVARNASMSVLPTVKFTSDTEENFWNIYRDLMKKLRETKDEKGKLLYFPHKAGSYVFPSTMDNIVKMWHSIQSSWNLMQSFENKGGLRYKQVAMIRSDVLYATPIDIYDVIDNRTVVVPGFARYDVNDRMIYGPYNAVKIWASTRFESLDKHVQLVKEKEYGFGMHSERFLQYTLFPQIRKDNYSIVEHESICFLRARANNVVRLTDCDNNALLTIPFKAMSLESKVKIIENILGRSCHGTLYQKRVKVLNCAIP